MFSFVKKSPNSIFLNRSHHKKGSGWLTLTLLALFINPQAGLFHIKDDCVV